MGARGSSSAGREARPLKSNSRDAALAVFLAWDTSRETADALLGAELSRARLSARDKDLAAEIVRGVFRWRGRLDWQLQHLVSRPLADLEPSVLWVLRLGVYQLDHLDRVPAHAAVDTAVELAKRTSGPGAAGLVNAVLRRATRELADLVEPDASLDPLEHLVCRTSHPRWLLARWLPRWGFRKTLAVAAAGNRKPSLTLRVVSDRVGAADILADLRAQGIEAQPGVAIPESVRLPEGWHAGVRELLDGGLCVVQDEAAGLVAYVGRPARGARVLDVCAGRGGKALHFAELCGDAEVVACDLSSGRLSGLARTLARVPQRAASFHLVVSDGTRPATVGGFARVLVDAPCTNTGVLARRPDARWRRGPEDLPRLAELQGRLLDASRAQVGAGGLLVYSTCSLEPEENEDVISAYLTRHPNDALLPADDVLPSEYVAGGCLRTDPAEHGMDGAFAAAIRVGGAAFRVLS